MHLNKTVFSVVFAEIPSCAENWNPHKSHFMNSKRIWEHRIRIIFFVFASQHVGYLGKGQNREFAGDLVNWNPHVSLNVTGMLFCRCLSPVSLPQTNDITDQQTSINSIKTETKMSSSFWFICAVAHISCLALDLTRFHRCFLVGNLNISIVDRLAIAGLLDVRTQKCKADIQVIYSNFWGARTPRKTHFILSFAHNFRMRIRRNFHTFPFLRRRSID